LSDENKRKWNTWFWINNITENQDDVDEATGKLTQIVHSISDKAYKTFHKYGRKNKKKYRQPWSDNVIYEAKREINSLENKIKHNPSNNVL
jgi:vacuolar-type H+-ATPase subunit H